MSENTNTVNTVNEAILDNLRSPKKVTTDAGTVEQHSLREQIEAAQFLEKRRRAVNPFSCIRTALVVPEGD